MKISLNLYDALVSISVPNEKAKAVVDAWETDVEQLASKSDLIQTENHLKSSITELGSELRIMIERQSKDFQGSISELKSNHRLLCWQFGILIVCIVAPFLSGVYEFFKQAIIV